MASTAALMRLRRQLGEFRELDREMSLTTALFFVEVMLAEAPGLQSSDATSRLEIASSGPRRYADLLGARGRGSKKKGLGLVDERNDAVDRRLKYFFLTKKGAAFRDRVGRA